MNTGLTYYGLSCRPKQVRYGKEAKLSEGEIDTLFFDELDPKYISVIETQVSANVSDFVFQPGFNYDKDIALCINLHNIFTARYIFFISKF